MAIAASGMLYTLLGLGVLRYFTDIATTLVLVTLLLGSNSLEYAVYDVAMSHTYLFAATARPMLWVLPPTRAR